MKYLFNLAQCVRRDCGYELDAVELYIMYYASDSNKVICHQQPVEIVQFLYPSLLS